MKNEFHETIRISIVGAGNVGSTFAYSLLLSGLVTEIVIIDANFPKAEGEAMDLNHAAPLATPTKVRPGSLADCAGSILTVITAGSAQKPGETRLDLVQRNTSIFQQIIPEVVKYNPNGILLIATNPVDILTYVAWKISGLPTQRVIGSGTILDTARFRYLLSQHLDVDPRSVHAYIIGEHGDSEVPVWSLANIAGMRLADYCELNNIHCEEGTLQNIFHQTRDAAYEIIMRKGATYYAIGTGLLRIAETVIRDQSTVLSVSSLINDYYGIKDIYLSLPSVLDRGGLERVIYLKLDDSEIKALQNSGKVIKDTIGKLRI
jgi:L-lactate dehydrogenase